MCGLAESGFKSTSLQELLKVMGLSKSRFYQTFGSKHALFQDCLERYQQGLAQKMRAQLRRRGLGKLFLKDLFQNIVNESGHLDAQCGCLLMNTASEFAQSDAKIARLVSESLENFTEVFESAILEAQKQGDIGSAQEAVKAELEAAQKLCGSIPNLYRGFPANPATLKVYLAFNQILKAHGVLSAIEQQLVYLTASVKTSVFIVWVRIR